MDMSDKMTIFPFVLLHCDIQAHPSWPYPPPVEELIMEVTEAMAAASPAMAVAWK